jgi:hypothetical protein
MAVGCGGPLWFLEFLRLGAEVREIRDAGQPATFPILGNKTKSGQRRRVNYAVFISSVWSLIIFLVPQAMSVRLVSWISGNFIYFEIYRDRMVIIRHSFDPEEFRAHESF